MERPASKGLAVAGGTPPSRGMTACSTPRLATGAATPRITGTALAASSNPKDALAGQLIKRMRMKFGEAAADLRSQDIITAEVITFMNDKGKSGKLKESDIATLQERIRSRIIGHDVPKNTLTTAKRAQVEGDEWAQIFEYHIAAGGAQDKAQAEARRRQQEDLKAVLAAQLAEQEARKKAERDGEMAYYRQEQAALKKAEQEEEARRKLRQDIMVKLKYDRMAQVDDRTTQRNTVLKERRAEEDFQAAKMAYETRCEFEKEEEQRGAAKIALKEFLLQNEANKALKEEAKQKRWEQDAQFKKQWEQILDKQEEERMNRLVKLKKIQTQQAEIAKGRPEAKRWLDQAIMDKYYKEKEDARAAEEARRVARVKDGAKAVAAEVAVQLKEREAIKAEQKRREQEIAAALAAKVRADEEAEQRRLAAIQAKKLTFRTEIEAQMRENAHRRRVAPMSETEKLINTKLLGSVDTWKSTGTISGLQRAISTAATAAH